MRTKIRNLYFNIIVIISSPLHSLIVFETAQVNGTKLRMGDPSEDKIQINANEIVQRRGGASRGRKGGEIKQSLHLYCWFCFREDFFKMIF